MVWHLCITSLSYEVLPGGSSDMLVGRPTFAGLGRRKWNETAEYNFVSSNCKFTKCYKLEGKKQHLIKFFRGRTELVKRHLAFIKTIYFADKNLEKRTKDTIVFEKATAF